MYKNKIDMEKVNLDGIRLYLKYLREEFFNVLIQQDIDLIDLFYKESDYNSVFDILCFALIDRKCLLTPKQKEVILYLYNYFEGDKVQNWKVIKNHLLLV